MLKVKSRIALFALTFIGGCSADRESLGQFLESESKLRLLSQEDLTDRGLTFVETTSGGNTVFLVWKSDGNPRLSLSTHGYLSCKTVGNGLLSGCVYFED